VKPARPRVATPPAAIRFGTSGWRGLLADEITAPRLRALAVAVARWAAESTKRRPVILVAHDTRFLGASLARLAAGALAANGARPVAAASPVPTPVVAHAVRCGEADAALVVTASHNEPSYQGVKVIAASGGGVTTDQARRIERLAAAAPSGRTSAPPAQAPRDLVAPYLKKLTACVDGDAIRAASPVILYDALHGTGAGVCDRALRALGAHVDVLNGRRSPRFGGAAPDPTPARLGALANALRARGGHAIGLATDGDADRYAVLDAAGALSESEALALLVDHLARTGRASRGVAISIATGTLVEKVAARHGLPVERHPIGFKHLSRALADGRADVAGEESGGFAWDPLARDKDGILACALFAEIVACGGSLRARLQQLQREHGRRTCGRVARVATAPARARLAALVATPPDRVGAARVQDVDLRDGVRLGFGDGFLMLRGSGTEPVLRLYAEASNARALAARVAEGWRLLGADV
jgi:phosphoglucomutase